MTVVNAADTSPPPGRRGRPETLDAVIIGGGPAGAAAARMLARLGREVVVVAGPPRARPPLAESLPPSCRKPLAALGMLEAVEGGGFIEAAGNLSSWGEADLVVSDFAASTGFQVVRDRLDDILVGTAVEAGARVLHGSAVVDADLDADPPLVRWRRGDARGSLRSRWVLDCSGRAGVLARRGLRLRRDGPSTIALVGVWRLASGSWLGGSSRTLVESYRDGWAWSVPVDAERRFVAAMVDPRATRLNRVGGIGRMYAAEIAKTRHLGPYLREATLEKGPWACAATPYGTRRHGGPNHLLVGDAGSFLDPLSSFGVKKALASGWLAAVVVHTSLATPSMRDAALSLFEEREETSERSYARLAARHHAAAGRFHRGEAFWERRSRGPDGDEGSHDVATAPGAPLQDMERGGHGDLPWPVPDPFIGELPLARGDPRLREALDLIRRTSPFRLTLSGMVSRTRHPTVRGTEIVLEERLTTGLAPRGIRYHLGVDLLRLIELGPGSSDVPDLYRAYLREGASPVALPEFLGALAAVVALGLGEVTEG